MASKSKRLYHLGQIWERSGRLGWNTRELHDKLKEWEFGSSLSALTSTQLEAVRSKIEALYESVKGDVDSQGFYVLHLMHSLNWGYEELNAFLVKKFKCKEGYTFADNWRNLKQPQRQGLISMFKNLILKEKDNVEKK